MEELILKIKSLTRAEIETVMQAVADWYRTADPQWDVFYVAMHKDPQRRKKDFGELLELAARDLQWSRQRWEVENGEGSSTNA